MDQSRRAQFSTSELGLSTKPARSLDKFTESAVINSLAIAENDCSTVENHWSGRLNKSDVAGSSGLFCSSSWFCLSKQTRQTK
jgi:hypothetical protein